jgi:hypothetical protein
LPLFLRALPLSLGTLWHYVFLLPLVLILCMPLALLTLIPLLGAVIASAIGTFVSIIGYRCALATYGRGNEPAFGALVRASMMYGLIGIFVGVIIMFCSAGVGLGLGWLGIDLEVPTPGVEALPVVSGVAVLVYLLLNSLYVCAMAVPMTAAAAAATRGGRDPGPFFGFGAGIISLIIVWFLWFTGIFFLGVFGTILEAIQAGLQETSVDFLAPVPEEPVVFRPVALAIAILYLLWGACWFCATAVLAWDRQITRRDAKKVKEVEVTRISSDELRALRESRMWRDEGPMP